MEEFKLYRDIHLFCVKADLFPDGIKAAHTKLASLSNLDSNRNHFGVSYWYDDKILYMAAAEIVKGIEEIPAGCETYTLRKGNYISIYISDFAKDPSQVAGAFKQLLDEPGIDPDGCCAECYLPESSDFTTAKDIRCMVRLAD